MKVLFALLLLLGTAAAQDDPYEAAVNSGEPIVMPQRWVTGSFGKPVAGVDTACNTEELQPLIEWYHTDQMIMYLATDVTTLHWEQMCGLKWKEIGRFSLDAYRYDRKTQVTQEMFITIDTVKKTATHCDGILNLMANKCSAHEPLSTLPAHFQRAVADLIATADKQMTLWNDKVVAAKARANQQ